MEQRGQMGGEVVVLQKRETSPAQGDSPITFAMAPCKPNNGKPEIIGTRPRPGHKGTCTLPLHHEKGEGNSNFESNGALLALLCPNLKL